MITDDRLDQLIRSSLEWEARRASARQPSLGLASHTLADRLGPSARSIRPRMVLAPSAVGGLNMITLILLLLALAATAVVVGALVLRTAPFDLRPGPFGHAVECRVGLRDGVVFELGTESLGGAAGRGRDRNLTLWRDGAYQTNSFATGAPTRAGTVKHSLVTQRLLTPDGVEQLRDRISDAGLTPGCRSLTTASMGGRISAHTDAGYVEVFWGPNVTNRPLARVLTPDEETELAQLVADLEEPTKWLPSDAFVEPEIHRVRPERWLVSIGVQATDHEPTDTITLQNGNTLSGGDPRYAQVKLPDGVGLLEYGTDIPVVRPDLLELVEMRCGELSIDDAIALAESLDSLDLGTDRGGDLFSPDLSLELMVSIDPVYPAFNDCAASAATMTRSFASLQTSTPTGELGAVDPCGFVPDGAAERILVTSSRTVQLSRLPLGLAANACVLLDAPPTVDDPFNDPYYGAAMLTLYPRPVDRDAAQRIALHTLGAELGEESIAGFPVWTNSCFSDALPCQSAVMALSGNKLIAFEFTDVMIYPDRWPVLGGPDSQPVPRVTNEIARQFVAEVLENLADL